MKKLIVRIIIMAMVFATVATPAEIGFAETAAVSGSSINTEKEITKEMDFLYIDHQKVEAPGTQNIAVSWDENIDAVTNMTLVYENSAGEKMEVKEKERTETSILFAIAFAENDTGVYTVKSLKYLLSGEECILAFDDVEIDANFEVVNEITETLEENVVTIENTGSSVNSNEVQTQVADLLDEAQATSKDDDKVIIVLDPGHGGSDPGAVRNGIKESTLNLKIAKACYEELCEYSRVEVYMTNGEPTLLERVEYAASVDADVLVSIHNNAATNTSVKGAEVYTPNKNYNKTVYEEGQALSKSILNELTALGLYNGGIRTKNSQDNTKYEDGSLADYYGIIRMSKERGITGIIVEHAYLSNASDRKFLSSDANLKKLGIADATGIANHFKLSKGEWEETAEGKKYRYAEGTYAVGYVKIKNTYYYFNDEGIMQKYSQTINGKPYYFKGTGKAAAKGWITFNNGTKKYCIGNGELATGYKKVGSYYYGFDSNGAMLKYDKMINGKPYYFNGNGRGKAKGWITYKDGSKKYSLGNGVLATGYKKVGSYYYGFSSNGTMLKYDRMINEKPYYFNGNGRGKAKGWITYKDGSKKYSLGNGVLATGYKKIGSYYYGFSSNGTMQKYDSMVNGKPYYFNGAGKGRAKGWITYKDGTQKYCLGNGKLATGTVKVEGVSYDFASDGTCLGKTISSKYAISGPSTVTPNQMAAYYKAIRGTAYPSEYKTAGAATIEQFCQIYYDECKAEGIKPEVAFCQAMHETGWLKFGGDVSVEQFNFAGIGATGGGNPGHSFENVTLGIRAHVQHLKAYANKEALVNECVDPRFDLVTRGSAPYVEWLGQNANPNGYGWAPSAEYGTNIIKLINKLKTY